MASDDSGNEGKTFTQDEVNDIVQERLRRQKDTLLRDIGVSSADEVKELRDKAEKFDKAEEAGASEVEKLTKKVTDLAAKLEAKDGEVAKVKLDAKKDALLRAKGLDPEKWARRITATTEDELEADIEELAGAVKPEAGSGGNGPIGESFQQGGNSGPDYSTAENMTMEEYAAARKDGSLK